MGGEDFLRPVEVSDEGLEQGSAIWDTRIFVNSSQIPGIPPGILGFIADPWAGGHPTSTTLRRTFRSRTCRDPSFHFPDPGGPIERSNFPLDL